jgi:hypothetical protein
VLVKILELPYEGKELSMLICLPMEIEDGTTGLEKVGTVQRGTRSKKNDRCTNCNVIVTQRKTSHSPFPFPLELRANHLFLCHSEFELKQVVHLQWNQTPHANSQINHRFSSFSWKRC